MTDNILNFPNKEKIFPSTLEESYAHIEQVRRDYCDEVSSDILEATFSVLQSYGLNVTPSKTNIKSIVFLEESIKAMVYTTKHLSHPFQDLAETAITLTEEAHQELDQMLEEKLLNT